MTKLDEIMEKVRWYASIKKLNRVDYEIFEEQIARAATGEEYQRAARELGEVCGR